jgi:SAM-dependent methyltransferase
MAEAGALKRALICQFARPHGSLGWLAGWIMAARGSNRLRNHWTVNLMRIEPQHRVLEIGFGPGLALAEVCARLAGGCAVGIDHSAAMVRMAGVRNRRALASGGLSLLQASAEDPGGMADPVLAGPFDRIFAVNVAQFWRKPEEVLRRLVARLSPEGAIYLTFQPRGGDTTDAAASAFGAAMAARMHAAGLERTRIEELHDVSPMAVCVIGAMAAR